MKFKPYGYQRYALDYILERPGSGLFLGLGLGKTVITLSAISELMYKRFEVSHVLVVAPLLVAQTVWSAEATKWDHTRYLRISKVLGDQKARVRALRAKADIYVINRENLSWLVLHYGRKWPFDMVVVDELSAFKSPKSKRFRSLRKDFP